MSRKIVLAIQLAAILALVVGAIAALGGAGWDAHRRERRRADAFKELARADDALAIRGASGLDLVPDWPDSLQAADWEVLDLWLAYQAGQALRELPGIGGGYYVPSIDRYVGHAGATREGGSPGRGSGRPVRERELIDDQVREALDLDEPVDRVVEMAERSIAVRAAPLRVNGRRVSATWALTALGDERPGDRRARTYQWASWLALGGLALALALSASLVGTIRSMAAERDRLELGVRRSERLAALGTLLAGVSHEMRNPLAGIRSTAQLWRRGLVTDEELGAELEGEVDRLDSLLEDLLLFSRDGGKSLVVGDVNDVVREAAKLASAAAESQGVVVELDLASTPVLVAMEAPTLLRALRNLTTNALQMMPDGGELRLSTGIDRVSGRVSVRVEDTGPGFSAEVAEHLFEPFFTTRHEGTGLGLAIAREIVASHGAEIRAEAPIGGGARFTIDFPRAGDDE